MSTLRLEGRILLAPMEGVTDRAFRDVVLRLGHVDGASTEFLRVSSAPLSRKIIGRELGPSPGEIPVAVQIMAPDTRFVAASVAAAEEAGASYIDLNFGCPVKCVFGKGAGSALLDHPHALGAIVREAAGATSLPVTAKLRAGVTDDARLEENLAAAAEAGAAAVILHARRRIDGYGVPARWEWIARAAAYLRARHPGVPLVGNGGIETAADVARMREETGCAAVMIGRGALADPFVFGRCKGVPAPSPKDAAGFALDYLDAMAAAGHDRYRLGRMKQLLRWYRAGDLFAGREDSRRDLLRARDLAPIRAFLLAS